MIPYSATDALNAMTAAYGIVADAMPTPERTRPPRVVRWLRSLAHFI